jgi:hypothetical protein
MPNPPLPTLDLPPYPLHPNGGWREFEIEILNEETKSYMTCNIYVFNSRSVAAGAAFAVALHLSAPQTIVLAFPVVILALQRRERRVDTMFI